jgi:hypothetical protein
MGSSCRSRFRRMGVTLLALLLVVCALGGCGGGGATGSASASGKPVTQSPGPTSTVPQGTTSSSSGSRSSSSARHSTAKPTHAQAPGSTGFAPPRLGGRSLRRFEGSGNTRLGTIVVSSPAVLAWTAERPAIQIFSAGGFLIESGHAHSGAVGLARGTYRGVRVASRSGWSVELRTRSR